LLAPYIFHTVKATSHFQSRARSYLLIIFFLQFHGTATLTFLLAVFSFEVLTESRDIFSLSWWFWVL